MKRTCIIEKALSVFIIVFLLGLFFFIPLFATNSVKAKNLSYDHIHFQGKIVNTDGTNVTNGTYNFRFVIYDNSTDGTPLWNGDYVLALNNGIIDVNLYLEESVFDNTDLHLQICFDANGVADDSSNSNCGTGTHRYEEVFSTRVGLTSVPYAFRARKLIDASGNSYDFSSFVQVAPFVAQVDTSDRSTLFLNKAGTYGNLIQLQSNGTDVFSVGYDGLITGTRGLALTGTTDINTVGVADTTIGSSGGGTITIGATSGSNLILQDAEWGVTGAGEGTFTSLTAPTIYGIDTLTLSGASNGSPGHAHIILNGLGQGNVAIGTLSPGAKLHVLGTTEQLRLGYDENNYYITTVGSMGEVTFDAVGTGASFTFNDDLNLSTGILRGSDSEQLLLGVTSDLFQVVRGGNTYEVCDSSGNCGQTGMPIGTGGQMMYNNAGTWEAFSDMYWDDTNYRLGIGTVSPDFYLDVSGNVRIESNNSLFFGGTGSSDYFGSINNTGSAVGFTFASNIAGSDTLIIKPQIASVISAFNGTLTSEDLTSNRTWILPNSSGTVAMTDSAMTGTFDGINLATGTQGGVSYFSSTTQLTSSAAGTSGQVLLSGGTGAPTWANISSLFTEGTAIDFTGTTNVTIAFDSTELGTTTWNTGTDFTWTFDTTATVDPTLAFGNGYLNLGNARFGIGVGGAPSYMLDIKGTSTMADFLRIQNASGANVLRISDIQMNVDVPTSFNTAGDVEVAYDLYFSNPIASTIASNSSLYLEAGDSFEAHDVVLRSKGSGNVVIEGDQASSYVAVISNTNTGTNADGLLIQIGNTGNMDNNNNFIEFRNGSGTAVGNIDGGGGSNVRYNTSGADYAEYFKSKSDIEKGYIVGMDRDGYAKKATRSTQILGVVSTSPGFVGGVNYSKKSGEYDILTGLMGQIPTVVLTTKNSIIKTGDPITLSAIEGVGILSEKPGIIVGRAMNSTESWNNESCRPVSNMDKISWPSFNKEKYPCFSVSVASLPEKLRDEFIKEYNLELTDDILLGRVMAYINVNYSMPAEYKLALEKLVTPVKDTYDNDEIIQPVDNVGTNSIFWVLDGETSIRSGYNVIASKFVGTIVESNIISTGTLSVAGDKFTVDSLGNLLMTGDIIAKSADLMQLATDSIRSLTPGKGVTLELRAGEKFAIKSTANGEVFTVNEHGKLSVKGASSNGTVGTDKIASGNKGYFVSTDKVTSSSKIFITLATVSDSPVAVTKVEEGKGFYVELKESATEDIQFNWWLVDVIN